MENKYTDNRGLLYTQKATLNAQLYLNNKLSLDKLGLSLAFLTLYLMGGGASNAPPLAKSAPVHQGLTFEWP